MTDDCIFCSIVAGDTPADMVYEDDTILFFRDISPKAPIHIVGIPKAHIVSLTTLSGDDEALIGHLLHSVAAVARDLEMAEDGYRVITNVGPNAGQDVQHLHFHILGGEPLGPLRAV